MGDLLGPFGPWLIRTVALLGASVGLLGGAFIYTFRIGPYWPIAWEVAIWNWRRAARDLMR